MESYKASANKDVEHQRKLVLERWAIEMQDIGQVRIMNEYITHARMQQVQEGAKHEQTTK